MRSFILCWDGLEEGGLFLVGFVYGVEEFGFFFECFVELEFEVWWAAHGEFIVCEFLDVEGGGLEAFDCHWFVLFGEDGDAHDGGSLLIFDIYFGDGDHASDAGVGESALEDVGEDSFEVGGGSFGVVVHGILFLILCCDYYCVYTISTADSHTLAWPWHPLVWMIVVLFIVLLRFLLPCNIRGYHLI